jgi:HlyD family secretion protein
MNNADMNPSAEKNKSPRLSPSPGRRRFWKWLVLAGLLTVLLFAGARWFFQARNGAEFQYRTDEARRGDLTVIVTATGNLEPTNQVEVGSEVSGTIATVSVDYNDFVKAGQELARLDTTKLEAQVRQSQAAVESARASLLQAQASVLEARSEMARLDHVRELSNGRLPSRLDLDTAEATLKRAEADVAMTTAKIAEAEAKLRVDQTNLEKAVIISPINGVVLKRSVEPGQTVAASLQAPILFTLAEDLAKMELHVDVDEADVGQVKEGQQATFTVDAYPDRVFPAHITQVRYGSEAVEGVVTYLTELNVDNSDLSLRPGMTATADIVVKELRDVLLVPNAALRYNPPQQEEEKVGTEGGSLLGKLFPRPSQTRPRKGEEGGDKKKQRIWTLREGRPVAVPVTTGATSGMMTEVAGGEVSPGMPVIVESSSKGN